MEPATIKNIVIYPVKSVAGIDLTYAQLDEAGLSFQGIRDHEYMFVREEPSHDGIRRFVTQRGKDNILPRPNELALIKPRLFRGTFTTPYGPIHERARLKSYLDLILTWNGKEDIKVDRNIDSNVEYLAREHEDTFLVVDQGDELAEWASDHLSARVRLVRTTDRFDRVVRQNYLGDLHDTYPPLKSSQLLFQDGYPIHWFPIESVRELSDIAGEEIDWRRFRPQIVVGGMDPQYEHRIHSGTIAGIRFMDPKPCDRCEVPTIDQKTGVVNPSQEPTRSLGTYKRWKNIDGKRKVIFGENMIPLEKGEIKVGDKMEVTSERDPPLVYGRDI